MGLRRIGLVVSVAVLAFCAVGVGGAQRAEARVWVRVGFAGPAIYPVPVYAPPPLYYPPPPVYYRTVVYPPRVIYRRVWVHHVRHGVHHVVHRSCGCACP